jgi:hypothetical protein
MQQSLLDHGDGTGQPGLVKQILEGTLQSDLTRDDLLDNITLYWLTNTGVSAARLWVPKTCPPHATWAYSWTSPPRRSRRATRTSGAGAG